MARSIAIIKQQILDTVATQTPLANLSPSNVAFWNLWAFIQAVAINLLEQVIDIYKASLEVLIASAPVGTPGWYQQQILNFQYSTTNAQAVTLINFVPGYTLVDSTLRIISRCSVKTDFNKIVQIKVAQGSPPAVLDGSMLTAIQAYVDAFGVAGTAVNFINLVSDKLFCQATIYYNGQFVNTIQSTVIAAMNNYLASLSSATNFDGILKLEELESAIMAVPGVNDVFFHNVQARLDTVSFGSGSNLVLNDTEIATEYETGAGYIIQETTGGETFLDSLTFIVQNN